MYLSIYTYVCVYVCVYMYTCMYVYMYVYVCTCMYVCVYVYVCVCVCLCVCVQLLPKHCASLIAVNVNRKKAKNRIPAETEKPGEESYRKHREEFTRFVTKYFTQVTCGLLSTYSTVQYSTVHCYSGPWALQYICLGHTHTRDQLCNNVGF